MTKLKIKKGDTVIVITGKDKGKKGAITKAFPKENKVLIEGVNVKKVHTKKGKKGSTKGQIIDRALPIHVSNVMIVDSGKTGRTRVGYKIDGDKKVRVSKKTNKELK